MNKRKIFMLALSVMMIAILAVGGTLAYLTDSDNETNVFTTGKVDIDLVENFDEENAKLLPGKQNAVQKEVWIELEEKSEDAYVWYTYAIPAVLDSTDGSTGTNNIIHVNSYGKTWDKYWNDGNTSWSDPSDGVLPTSEAMTWDHDPDVELPELVGPQGLIGTKTIDDIKYNVYLVLYHGVLSELGTEGSVGTKTTIAMSQVYMDAGVDTKLVDGKTVYVDKNGDEIDYDFTKGINIIVNAYAIQAEGFKDVYEAYTNNPVTDLD